MTNLGITSSISFARTGRERGPKALDSIPNAQSGRNRFPLSRPHAQGDSVVSQETLLGTTVRSRRMARLGAGKLLVSSRSRGAAPSRSETGLPYRDACSRDAKQQPAHHSFTLIELLAVITLIALLAGMALPTLGRAYKRCKATARRVEFNRYATVVNALDEPGNIIDPATGRETQYYTNGTFTNWVFTIEKVSW